MAKLLTQIWKTIQGKYFETEEEALEAERRANFFSAWKEISKPYDEKYQQEVDIFYKSTYNSRGSYPKPSISLPGEFLVQFYEKLKEQELLAPIVISNNNNENIENNS